MNRWPHLGLQKQHSSPNCSVIFIYMQNSSVIVSSILIQVNVRSLKFIKLLSLCTKRAFCAFYVPFMRRVGFCRRSLVNFSPFSEFVAGAATEAWTSTADS